MIIPLITPPNYFREPVSMVLVVKKDDTQMKIKKTWIRTFAIAKNIPFFDVSFLLILKFECENSSFPRKSGLISSSS